MNNTKSVHHPRFSFVILSIIVIGMAAYAQIFTLGFTHWDDNIYVLQNIFIRAFSLQSIIKFFSNTILGNYAPLHLLSYSVDFQLWGLNPLGYHLMNLFWHILNGVGIFYLVSMITRQKNTAWLASILFTIHPVNVETVAWISQRKTLMAQFFFILSFIKYLQYTDRSQNRDYSLSLLFFVFSLLCKVSTITMPIILLLYDYYYLDRLSIKSIKDKFPFVFISVFFGIIALYAQFIAYEGELLLHGGSLFSNILTMLVALKNYILLMAFPFNLSAYYYFSYQKFFLPQVIFSILFLLLISGLLIYVRKRRAVIFWAGWFLVALLPNIHIVPLDAVMGDRYMYLPAVGIFALFAMGATKLLHQHKLTTMIGKMTAASVLVVCVVFVIASYQRVGIWKNDLTLWSSVIERTPSPVAYNNLAVYWGREGDFARSQDFFKKALVMDPNNFQANKNMGSLSMMKRDFYTAENYYKKALSLRPQAAAVKLEMGSMYTEKGHFKKAREILNSIPESSPYYQEALRRLSQMK